MHYKVTLVLLLSLTAINARSIRFYFPQTIPAQDLPLSIEPPSRYLLPPFEDNEGSQLYAHGIAGSEQPDWRLESKSPASYEHVEPQSYAYEVANRVLPEVQELTDFQPIEQQITTATDEVKNVRQPVDDFENSLQHAASTLVPQNRARNGVLRITFALVPKLGEVPTSSSAEKAFENSISSISVEGSTASESAERAAELENLSPMREENSIDNAEMDKQLANLLSSMFEEDSIVEESANSEKELENLLSSMFEEDSIVEESAKSKKELENLHSSMIEEDFTVDESAKFDQELENLLSSMIEEDSIVEESAKSEKELENLLSSMIEEDSPFGDSAKIELNMDNLDLNERELDYLLSRYIR